MLSRLTSWFAKPYGPITEQEAFAATTEDLRRMLPECPTCLRSLSGHHYGKFSIAAGKPDLSNLLNAAAERRWRDLRGIQSFQGDRDAFEAIAIRCTERSGALLCTLNPVELYQDSAVLRHHTLDSDEWLRMLDAAPDLRWHPF